MKIPHFRYVIAGLLLLATMINYADRLMLSVVSPQLRREFGMDEQDYGHILFCFMAAYAFSYAVSGAIVDRIGVRRGFAAFISFWSLAAMAHALAVGKWSLAFCRVLLGLGEPGNWPAAAKAVAEWFPPEQRALGVGIFNSGAFLGSAITPPVVAFLTLRFGWRVAFLFTASLGFLWLIAWLMLYQPPAKCRHITQRELTFLAQRVKSPEPAPPGSKGDWWKVLRMRECYALALARFFTDPVSYFVIFWLPEYLTKERNFNLQMIGAYVWAPFVFGDIGQIFGGWLSGWLMRRGWSLLAARRFGLALAAAMMPPVIFAPYVPQAWMAIGFICLVTFGHAIWMSNLQTLPADLFPGWRVGTAAGLAGMGGAIGGMLANLATGHVVHLFSYKPIFAVAGLMHPLAVVLVSLLLLRRPAREALHPAAPVVRT